MNHASCLCGGIAFSVSMFEPRIAHCHCKMCQKFHGAAFSTLAEVKIENLTWLQGKEQLVQYQAENGTIRQFCAVCGASITFESKYNRDDETIEIALAIFDQLNSSVQVDAHIYVRSKAAWLTVEDKLPKYQKFRH